MYEALFNRMTSINSRNFGVLERIVQTTNISSMRTTGNPPYYGTTLWLILISYWFLSHPDISPQFSGFAMTSSLYAPDGWLLATRNIEPLPIHCDLLEGPS
jgi:hypothetical protein